MVARAGGYYGEAFKGARGLTQGEPLLPTIFNVVVDAVVRHWVTMLLAYDALPISARALITGTATLKTKLLHQLANLRKEVLYGIFLDLHKAYDALERSRCLEILEGYGVGPRARWLLRAYWGKMTMVARAGG